MRKLALDLNKITDLYLQGQSCVEIAKKYGCDHKVILNRLNALGIKRHANGFFQKRRAHKLESKKCLQCGKQFDVSYSKRFTKYCSLKCRFGARDLRAQVDCLVCGKSLLRSPSRAKNAFCSLSCRSNATIAGNKNITIKEFLSLKPFIKNILHKKRKSSAYREWRKEVILRDKKCQKCGDKNSLIVHHIKEFSKYPELALVKSNGVVLCVRCHINLHRNRKKIKYSNGDKTRMVGRNTRKANKT